MTRHTNKRKRGMTFIEVAISTVVLAIIFASLGLVLKSIGSLYDHGSRTMTIEDRGNQIMRKVVDGLRAADSPSIGAVPSPPFSVAQVDYQWNEGFSGQATTWSGPRRIVCDPAAGTIVWSENLGDKDLERTAVWATGIPPLLDGEQFNGKDDNGNGLIDEGGFCITREDDLITIRLTMVEPSASGEVLTRTWESKLLIRN